MTPDDAKQLLAHAAAFDNRQPSLIAAKAWAEALADIPLDRDALTAVSRFYGTPTQDDGRRWIEPHHIRAIRTRIRAERIENAHPVYDGNPDESPSDFMRRRRAQLTAAGDGQLPPQPIRAALTGGPAPNVRETLGEVGVLPSDDVRAALRNAIPNYQGRPELVVACPHCRAQPGNRCHTPSGRQLGESHPSRKDARFDAPGPTPGRSNETTGAWPRPAAACSPTAGSIRPAERPAGAARGID